MKKLLKKLGSASGETLVESLLTILIMLLVMGFLTMSIITAQKMNAAVKTEDTSFRYGGTAQTGSVSLKIGPDSAENITVKYFTDNDYKYYKFK